MDNQMDTTSPAATIKCWVELYSDAMFTWAFHKTSSKETAEDLVQETFLAAVHGFEKFKGDSNPHTWLFSILNNKINDFYRSAYRMPVTGTASFLDQFFDSDNADAWKPEQRPEQWAEEAGHLLDNAEFVQVFHRCLKKLPGNWFSAIQLKFLEERKGGHICQELGITNTNFWQILHRAKLQLRKCLELNYFKR